MAEAGRGHYGLGTTPLSFKRHRFPPAIIKYAVWPYVRFTLSIDAAVYNAFYVQHHLLKRRVFEEIRAETLAVRNQSRLAA